MTQESHRQDGRELNGLGRVGDSLGAKGTPEVFMRFLGMK